MTFYKTIDGEQQHHRNRLFASENENIIHITWFHTYARAAQHKWYGFKISKRLQQNWTFSLFTSANQLVIQHFFLYIQCCGSRYCHFGGSVRDMSCCCCFVFFSSHACVAVATNRHCHLLVMRVNNALYAAVDDIYVFTLMHLAFAFKRSDTTLASYKKSSQCRQAQCHHSNAIQTRDAECFLSSHTNEKRRPEYIYYSLLLRALKIFSYCLLFFISTGHFSVSHSIHLRTGFLFILIINIAIAFVTMRR